MNAPCQIRIPVVISPVIYAVLRFFLIKPEICSCFFQPTVSQPNIRFFSRRQQQLKSVLFSTATLWCRPVTLADGAGAGVVPCH